MSIEVFRSGIRDGVFTPLNECRVFLQSLNQCAPLNNTFRNN